jgi:hypothetical protein
MAWWMNGLIYCLAIYFFVGLMLCIIGIQEEIEAPDDNFSLWEMIKALAFAFFCGGAVGVFIFVKCLIEKIREKK